MKKWMILVLLAGLCCGCGADLTEESQQQIHFVKAEQEIGDRTPEERALLLKSRLKQVEGIIGTGVVVEGHTAIIGLRLEEGVDVSAVKKAAAAAVREAGGAIDNISITTNTYIVSLIEETERHRAG